MAHLEVLMFLSGCFSKDVTFLFFLLTRHHRDETYRVRCGVKEQTKSIDNVPQSSDNIIQLNRVIFICIVHIVTTCLAMHLYRYTA